MVNDDFSASFADTAEDTGAAMTAILTGIMLMNNFIGGMMENMAQWINSL